MRIGILLLLLAAAATVGCSTSETLSGSMAGGSGAEGGGGAADEAQSQNGAGPSGSGAEGASTGGASSGDTQAGSGPAGENAENVSGVAEPDSPEIIARNGPGVEGCNDADDTARQLCELATREQNPVAKARLWEAYNVYVSDVLRLL